MSSDPPYCNMGFFIHFRNDGTARRDDFALSRIPSLTATSSFRILTLSISPDRWRISEPLGLVRGKRTLCLGSCLGRTRQRFSVLSGVNRHGRLYRGITCLFRLQSHVFCVFPAQWRLGSRKTQAQETETQEEIDRFDKDQC